MLRSSTFQRDGTFSDILANPDHHLHPSTLPEEKEEFDEDEHARFVDSYAASLPKQGRTTRFPAFEVLSRALILRESLNTAIQVLQGGTPDTETNGHKLVAAHERWLRYMWNNGNSTKADVVNRLAACTWTFFPTITGAKSQTELLRFLGIRDRQQFNTHVRDCANHFSYINPLMRGEKSRANMRIATARRLEKTENK